MATTFLSNATINCTQGATTYDLSSQANQVTLTIGQDALEVTTFNGGTSAAGGHIFAGGLQTVDIQMTLFLSYGNTASPNTEVETALAAMVGKGNTTLVISPSGTTEGPSDPEYTIANCMLASFTPINSTVGEIATVQLSWQGGTWSRDVIP